MFLITNILNTSIVIITAKTFTKQKALLLVSNHANGSKLFLLQIPASKSRLDSGDVFILDMGLTIYQWNGSGASVFEKQKVRAALSQARFPSLALRALRKRKP